MNAGRKLLEALLIYCKIDVTAKLNEMKGIKPPNHRNALANGKDGDGKGDKDDDKNKFAKIKVSDLEKELTENKKLIEMTKGDEDGEDDDGSDSEPSEDNLEEEEMAKIIPIKPKKKPAEPNPKLSKFQNRKLEVLKKPSRSKVGDYQKSPTNKPS